MMRVLVVEDEIKIARVIEQALKHDNFAVDVSHNGEEGYLMAESQSYAIIVLDRMLPGMNGLDIIKKLRQNKIMTPILLLTALGTVENKTEGLDSGADDYLVKPFSIDELSARVRALLRRPPISHHNLLQIADIKLDQRLKTVHRGDKLINLTAKEYALLEYLMRHPNQILSKDHLINNVWDFDADILPNNVEAYIKNLRRKIDKPFKKALIKTVRGFGYKVES